MGLAKYSRGQNLPIDPAFPQAGPQFYFQATAAQKANAAIYLNEVVRSPQAMQFYRDNNIQQPTIAQIAAAASKHQSSINDITQLTIQSAAVAGALALAPALSGLATEAYAFTQNPVAYCTLNPAGCIVAADLAAATVAGVPVTGVAIPSQVGKAVTRLAEAEFSSVKAAERVSVGSLAEAGGANLALESKANGELLTAINSLGSKTSARGSSVMVGAYDSTTGLTSVGSSGALKAEDLSPAMVKFVEDKLGVPIGQATSFCSNLAGFCAEVKAADTLVRQGVNPANIKFTNPVRPGMVYGNTSIPENAFVPACANCSTTWPNGYRN